VAESATAPDVEPGWGHPHNEEERGGASRARKADKLTALFEVSKGVG
jgi:hypothetical protein